MLGMLSIVVNVKATGASPHSTLPADFGNDTNAPFGVRYRLNTSGDDRVNRRTRSGRRYGAMCSMQEVAAVFSYGWGSAGEAI